MFSEGVEWQIDLNRPKNGPVPGRPVNGYVFSVAWGMGLFLRPKWR